MTFCIRCGSPLAADGAGCPCCAGSPVTGQEVWLIGRAHDCDVVLDYPIISSHHCRVTRVTGGFDIEDLGSANGTHFGQVGNRITGKVRVPPNAVLFLGSYRFPLSMLPASRGDRLMRGLSAPGRRLELTARRQIIGRDSSADIVVDHPQISRRHACLEVKGGSFIVSDLGSANGTFVNGRRIRTAVLEPGDEVALGPHRFSFTPDRVLSERSYSGDVTVCVDGLWVAVKDSGAGKRKVLLEDVSFTVYPGELVGIMGPSGSGKTTLLYAMLGIVKPTRGRCLLNGKGMLEHYDQLRSLIGYVPQDDIIHPELTAREALAYAGRLRLPPDITDKELDARVLRTLELVNLKDAADVLVGSPEKKGISGGQRKRLNIALELLTEPSVIFLDEPTSGLSSEDAVALIHELRNLTNVGKTVVLTIHQPGYRIYSTFDNVLILAGKTKGDTEVGITGALPGRLGYYGPAVANFGNPEKLRDDSITFFNPEVARLPREERVEFLKDPEAPLAGMDRKPSSHWVQAYRNHALYNEYVASRSPVSPSQSAGPSARCSASSNPFRQWWVLTKRYALTKRRDLSATLGLLVQAPVIGILIAMVFGKKDGYDIPVFLLAVVAIWFGCINAVAEFVKEKAVFRRERMVFLQIVPYALSKVAVLGLLAFVQSTILLWIVRWELDLAGDFAPMLGIMFLCSMGGLAMGLFLSAIRPTLGSAMSILPIVLTVQIVLGGALQPIPDMDGSRKSFRITPWIAQVTLSRWGYEALLSIEEQGHRKDWSRLECMPPACTPQPSDLFGRPQREGVCMKFPQTSVCCKFQAFQLVGQSADRSVKWKKCTAKSRFEKWQEVPLSSIPGNACALLAIVLLSFLGVLLALKLKN